MNIYEKLTNIQSELNCPKNQHNNFGNYNYRSCEDILEAVKPLLAKNKLTLTISDEIIQIGDRYYVRAIASLTDIEKEKIETIQSEAYAREDENKKGMDLSQVTGASSSYARKYALNGLFCIDDMKDADTDAYKKQQDKGNNKSQNTYQSKATSIISEPQRKRLYAIAHGNNEVAKRVLARYGYESSEQIKISDYEKICDEVEAEINL